MPPKAYSVGLGARGGGQGGHSPQSLVNGMAGNRQADAYSNFSGMSQPWQQGPGTVSGFDSKSVQRAQNRQVNTLQQQNYDNRFRYQVQ